MKPITLPPGRRVSDAAPEIAILSALPAQVALLDANGRILSVNDAWRRFGKANAIQSPGSESGDNYLDICDRARGEGASDAHQAAEGIRSILEGRAPGFSMEYPCHSPAEQRWFTLTVAPLREDRLAGAVVMHVNTTEHKRSEQSAQLNQRRLRLLINGLGPSMFVGLLNPQGIVMEANRPALDAAGLKAEEVIGQPFADGHWWAHSPHLQEQLREAIVRAARGEASRFDMQFHAAKGLLIDLDFSLQPVRDERGAIVFLVPSASVITERKRTETALRESNQNFEQLTANISDAFWIRSADLRDLMYVSPAFERIWGRSVESLFANPDRWIEFIVPADRELVLKAFAALAGEARTVEIEYRIVRPSGEIRWVRLRGFQVRNATDELIRLSGIVTDITEARRAADELHARLEEFRTLAEAMPQMVWITGPDGMNIYVNQQWMDYTGLTLEESLGQGWNKPLHPDDQERGWVRWQSTAAATHAYTEECRLRRADGVYRWWLIRGVPLLDAEGKILKWFGTCTDIHDLKLVEAALVLEKENAQIRLSSIGDAVICTDNFGNITFLNSVAEKMTGWPLEEATGRQIADVVPVKDLASGETASTQIIEAVREDRTAQLLSNCTLSRRDGMAIPIEGSVASIHGHEGQRKGAVIIMRDVSAARTMALQLAYLVEHDSLTGLPNRVLLNDRLEQAIALAMRHSESVAVLFLDLDGFKHINDSLGHAIGDRLLQSLAKRLLDCVRASDTVSRQGGDEFVVLLSALRGPEDAALIAGKMLRAVAEPHSIDEHDLHVSASIGLSIYPADGLDAGTLIKNADTAMYQAKENGRQSVQFFQPSMNVRAVERHSIESSLRRALERQEFVVHYQPKVSLSTGQITGAEALVRWLHPTRGMVPPGQFIPIAENCGLIVPIGNWVLHEACRQARVWTASGLPALTMSVNVSAMELGLDTFLEGILGVLAETGLDATSLELELTESVLMKRAEAAASVLRELRARGVRIAVDDFGTGYSSLSYLRKFPIDALKIDQSFVREITVTPDDTTIVRAIIGLGKSMKLRVIAEGVETAAELSFLQGHQCDDGQGYHFSRPVPPGEFAKLLKTGVWPKGTSLMRNGGRT